MWIKLTIIAVVICLALSKVFPPPVSEEYPGGELTLSSVCSLFHFPSEHLMIRDGYYFNKVLKRLNNNIECSRQLVFNEDNHVALKVSEMTEMKD